MLLFLSFLTLSLHLFPFLWSSLKVEVSSVQAYAAQLVGASALSRCPPFPFLPPTRVALIGSAAEGTVLKPLLLADVAVEMPRVRMQRRGVARWCGVRGWSRSCWIAPPSIGLLKLGRESDGRSSLPSFPLTLTASTPFISVLSVILSRLLPGL